MDSRVFICLIDSSSKRSAILFKSFIFSEASLSIPGTLSDEKLLLTIDKVSFNFNKIFYNFSFFLNSSNSPETAFKFLSSFKS